MPARVGIVGWANNSGLGNAAYDFARHLAFAKWLVIDHPELGVNQTMLDERCVVRPMMIEVDEVEAWLRGLDTVFSIQTGYVRELWTPGRRGSVGSPPTVSR